MTSAADLLPLPPGLVAVTGDEGAGKTTLLLGLGAAPSARVIREFLADVADHETRTWVVADYEADVRLPWRRHIALG